MPTKWVCTCGMVAIAFALLASQVSGLTVCPQESLDVQCKVPCEVRVPILVTGTGHLDALGLDFEFESDKLAMSRVERGSIIKQWLYFDARLLDLTHVRLGGFDTTGFELSGTDTLAVLVFAVASPKGQTTYTTQAFVDDFIAAVPCTGSAKWGPTPVDEARWWSIKTLFR